MKPFLDETILMKLFLDETVSGRLRTTLGCARRHLRPARPRRDLQLLQICEKSRSVGASIRKRETLVAMETATHGNKPRAVDTSGWRQHLPTHVALAQLSLVCDTARPNAAYHNVHRRMVEA